MRLKKICYRREERVKKIILKTLENIHLVKVRDINYCESEGSYTAIHLLNGKNILVSNILKDYDELLKDSGFYRVHKSFLINIRHIERFEKTDGGYVVLENEVKVPKHVSMATKITQERINLLNKKKKRKISFTIIDLKDELSLAIGTKVVIEIPIEVL